MNTWIKEMIMNGIKKWFPEAKMYGETENSASIVCGTELNNVFEKPDEYMLKSCVHTGNTFMIRKAFPARFTVMYYDYGEIVPGGIHVDLVNIWEEDLGPLTMSCIVNRAIQNKLPVDDLSKVQLDDIEYAIRNSEDGIGIESSEYSINFTVEAINYCNCDGDPDDPNWSYCMIPCLWYYSGTVGDFRFEGLASSQNLGIGKAIKAIYRIAKKHQLQIAEALEKNVVKFHSYGFCH